MRYFLREFREADGPATGRLKRGQIDPPSAAISFREGVP